MDRKRFAYGDDGADLGPGPYDPDPLDEGDAWFLPGEAEDDPSLPPLPRADRSPLIDPDAWLRAEREQGARLADLAFRFGQLDARLRAAGQGALARLALAEAEELSWWCGDRVTQDRLVLWVEMSLGGVQEDNAGLLRASWAWRRLMTGPGPGQSGGQGGWTAGLSAFLGREGAGVADLVDLMAQAGALHPLTRGALLFHGWRLAGPGGPAGDLEAAVMAARAAADLGAGQGGAPFLPIGLAGFTAHRAGADVGERLGAWIASAERAVLAALMRLDRLRDWQAAARERLADLQGRTPPLLVDLFADLPIVTAPLAEAKTGAGRATVQRNLTLMEDRGLTREMTGQGRYRVWTAKL